MSRVLVAILLVAGCTVSSPSNEAETGSARTVLAHIPSIQSKNQILVATQYIGYSEKKHRAELKELMGVDPVRVEWCAAFVNAILRDSRLEDNYNHANHLTARSFLEWGYEVTKPKSGDLVIFPRGDEDWQGHVGFYIASDVVDGVEYYWILGGNQGKEVSIERFRASTSVGIRRPRHQIAT